MVIRTITTDWLKRNGACEGGIALFRALSGERATIKFDGKGLKWLKINTYKLRTITVNNKGLTYPQDDYTYYIHCRWLFRKIASKSPELLQDLADNGIDLDEESFYVESSDIKIPAGYTTWRGVSDVYWLQRINNQLWIVGM